MKSVIAKQAWDIVANDKKSVLVDVRTPQEWAEVGVPDTSALAQPLICLTWGHVPEGDFIEAFKKAVPDETTSVYMLCRSGVRSYHAGLAVQGAGYENVTNIIDGFEDKHGPTSGWRASGLPVAYRPLSGS
ncbi:rhodanese-like domain-containing protein [Swingsia samuiensis]|uniref:Rhodanese domain-containing protein n=1 Tax=Swingsia samuiensis TaxID=1293412 RepID=A0A4Y6UKP2_9PROT|nr:rhodanese-like domain-containing protein [Swingsia samuiensis]QDH16595.1 hypothetical protein E3D00_02670 [Swingsia samuiensis]